jgi:PPK2 family polyphosphate:nucleotide phosphotransferase
MQLSRKLRIEPGTKVHLSGLDPNDTLGFEGKAAVLEGLQKNLAELAKLQYLLYAENKRALLVVLQAMDAGGKDGTIRHVMSGLNPQGCRVTSFKVPSAEEADHDFLWRIHHAVPPKGEIGIFNRSHYEDVLVVRVHRLVPKSAWSRRYDEINGFEKLLTDNDMIILKFFLHISKEEQLARLRARLDDPSKNWKISPADFEERKRWDDYVAAYEDVLDRCSTPTAPWFVIPADKKWVRNYAVSEIIVQTLRGLKMQFPAPAVDVSSIHIE